MTTIETATVEVLTAEVRVLQVGRRQVTLSVFRQLDFVGPGDIEPFGRVRDPAPSGCCFAEVVVVGQDRDYGTLVRSHIGPDHQAPSARLDELAAEWAELPLIVLAGLR